jgi:CRP-like cAMP-binding protein
LKFIRETQYFCRVSPFTFFFLAGALRTPAVERWGGGRQDRWAGQAAAPSLGHLVRALTAALTAEDMRTGARLQGLFSCPLFKRLDPAAQNRLLLAGKEQEFAPGDLLVRQGDEAGSMFFIDGGLCSAVQDGKDIDKLGMGDCFGCMAIIQNEIILQRDGLASSCFLAADDAPRRYLSVRADTPVLAWELDVDTAIDIFASDANTWAYFYQFATSKGRMLLALKPHPSHDELIPRSPRVSDAGQIEESERGTGQGKHSWKESPPCAAEDAPSSPSAGASKFVFF